MAPNPITIEGYTPDELLGLPDEQLSAWVFCGQPVTFRIGSAEVLGEFRRDGERLTLELAQIDGGGEGVLLALWRLVERYAAQEGLREVEWIVHALNCARPNPKLPPFLHRLGFVVEDVPGIGLAYHLVRPVGRGQGKGGG
jgi:hypothetical protein